MDLHPDLGCDAKPRSGIAHGSRAKRLDVRELPPPAEKDKYFDIPFYRTRPCSVFRTEFACLLTPVPDGRRMCRNRLSEEQFPARRNRTPPETRPSQRANPKGKTK